MANLSRVRRFAQLPEQLQRIERTAGAFSCFLGGVLMCELESKLRQGGYTGYHVGLLLEGFKGARRSLDYSSCVRTCLGFRAQGHGVGLGFRKPLRSSVNISCHAAGDPPQDGERTDEGTSGFSTCYYLGKLQ